MSALYEKGQRVRQHPRTLRVGTVRRVEWPRGVGGSYMLVYVKWDGEGITRNLASEIAPLEDADREHGLS